MKETELSAASSVTPFWRMSSRPSTTSVPSPVVAIRWPSIPTVIDPTWPTVMPPVKFLEAGGHLGGEVICHRRLLEGRRDLDDVRRAVRHGPTHSGDIQTHKRLVRQGHRGAAASVRNCEGGRHVDV